MDSCNNSYGTVSLYKKKHTNSAKWGTYFKGNWVVKAVSYEEANSEYEEGCGI